jgi:hypothetical protein
VEQKARFFLHLQEERKRHNHAPNKWLSQYEVTVWIMRNKASTFYTNPLCNTTKQTRIMVHSSYTNCSGQRSVRSSGLEGENGRCLISKEVGADQDKRSWGRPTAAEDAAAEDAGKWVHWC